jgi:hypothetical protein
MWLIFPIYNHTEPKVEEKVLGPVKQDKIRLESAKSNMGGDLGEA